MYALHFGLKQDPFSIAPDPRYLFMSERHREALAHLLYGVQGTSESGHGGGGFVLLTGDIGTGKTTVCRCFLEQIPAHCHVAYIFNPKLSVIELLQSICEEFHVDLQASPGHAPSLKDYINALNLFLLQSHAAGQSSVLIIDEAQNLERDVLEQLRLLTNLETSECKLLQIVLIGQPELRTLLARPELEQLAQRVIARFHLDALSQDETHQYIAHRLGVAGHVGALPFDARALRRIYQRTRGVPRRINLLCGRALLGAWANGLSRVNRKVVDRAAAEVFDEEAPNPRGLAWPRWTFASGGLLVLAGMVWVGMAWVGMKAAPVDAGIKTPAATNVAPAAAIEDPGPLLSELTGDINVAWHELAASWGLADTPDEGCQVSQKSDWQCYRTSKMTLPQVRLLDRPVVVTLKSDTEAPRYAVLVGLTDQTATLQLQGRRYTVRLVTLAQRWRGDVATFWRTPPGYQVGMPDGSTGFAVTWLAERLSQLDGAAPAPPNTTVTLDAALRTRVQSFQRSRGIEADGQPGPMTFMQLESATGGYAPQLLHKVP